MKNLFTKILSIIVSLLMAIIFVLFFVLGFNELKKDEEVGAEVTNESQEFVSKFSSTSKDTVEDIETPKVLVQEVSSSDIERQIDYESVEVDKFLYNQLDEDEKYIYKAFEKNKEEMKTGTATVELGDYFNDILKRNDGDTEILRKVYQSAVEAYTYDNPDVFYLDPNKMYLTVGTKTNQTTGEKNYEVYVDIGEGSSYLIDEFSSREQVNNALAQVEEMKNQLVSKRTGNTYQDIKMVHDYLVDTIEYDQTLSKENIYNIYGALINKVCVCEGYARSFKYILEAMNIPCVIVVGTGTNSKGQTERHAWNYVQCDGKWYAVDVTWDDPVVRNGGQVRNEDKVKYFMKSSQEFNAAHSPSNQFTTGGKSFKYPDV